MMVMLVIKMNRLTSDKNLLLAVPNVLFYF